METKKCSKCGIEKEINEFRIKKSYNKFYVCGQCKACEREYYLLNNKKYKEKHKEEISKQRKQYRIENKEKLNNYQKEYYKKNKEIISEKRKKYAEKNREKSPLT